MPSSSEQMAFRAASSGQDSYRHALVIVGVLVYYNFKKTICCFVTGLCS